VFEMTEKEYACESCGSPLSKSGYYTAKNLTSIIYNIFTFPNMKPMKDMKPNKTKKEKIFKL